MQHMLVISTSADLVRAEANEIVFISSDGNYSTFMFTHAESRVLTIQLGQVETMISKQLQPVGNTFIRIGRSLIINRRYIRYINPGKQQLVLSDGHAECHTLTASRDALKQLKNLIEKEEQ